MRSRASLLLVAALVLFAPPVSAVLEITITEGAPNARPIAVVPFGWQGEDDPPEDIADIVGDDLTRTGRFAPAEERDLVARPTTGEEVRYGNWGTLGVDHVVVGRVSPNGEQRYRVQFQLLDVLRERQVAGYSYQARRGNLRGVAHEISDVIFEQVTGIRGAANTRVGMVSVDESGEEPEYRLQIADYDGYNARTILTSPAPIMSPALAPDGERIAYVSFERRRAAIFVQEIRTGERRRVSAQRGINGAPAWSPDGERLAVTLNHEGSPDIYVLDVAGGDLQRVTRGGAIDTSPTWMPNGGELIFTSDRSGGPQLYRVPVDRSERAQRVTFGGPYNADPDVSPDGEHLTYVHRTQNGDFRIAVMDLRSDQMRVVTDGRLDESPSFAPNGEMILFATDHQDRGVLGLV
ncbi:MAG: Tol-Pal system beta propeller repeat protein TolB, partial [Halofilum sp. (in: g-proteobacteria)]